MANTRVIFPANRSYECDGTLMYMFVHTDDNLARLTYLCLGRLLTHRRSYPTHHSFLL